MKLWVLELWVRLTMTIYCLWYLLLYDGLYSPVYSWNIYNTVLSLCSHSMDVNSKLSMGVMNVSVSATPFVLSASTNHTKSSLTSTLFYPSFLSTNRTHIEICSFVPESVASPAKRAKEGTLLQSCNNNLQMKSPQSSMSSFWTSRGVYFGIALLSLLFKRPASTGSVLGLSWKKIRTLLFFSLRPLSAKFCLPHSTITSTIAWRMFRLLSTVLFICEER